MVLRSAVFMEEIRGWTSIRESSKARPEDQIIWFVDAIFFRTGQV